MWAIADSGASHVLLRASDSFLLTALQFTVASAPAYAVLKAANGANLAASGRGIFTIAGISVTAYVFPNKDLVNNLLGLAPFVNLGCTAVFKRSKFQLYLGANRTPILSGKRNSNNSLWNVDLSQVMLAAPHPDGIPPPQTTDERGVYVEANAITAQEDARSYVNFVHACLGYPAPSTFLNAVTNGFITEPEQFPRLTTKMVCKHLPNTLPTAKCHLDRTPSALPHAASDAASSLARHHTRTTRAKLLKFAGKALSQEPFSVTGIPRSTTLHMDYTGPLPEPCLSGTRYFQIAVWGGYINLQPLPSLRAEPTTIAPTATVAFFRSHGVTLDTLRMDSQTSQPFINAAKQLGLAFGFVTPYVKQGNRAKRSIRTAKNHVIAKRAGFHPDCRHACIDKCLLQIELTLNIVKPFDYDPTKSAYEGLHGHTFNFQQHLIVPVGSKVLT